MKNGLDVLLLEDSVDDAKLVERALHGGGVECKVRRAGGRHAFLDALKETPDVILADYRLPDFDGRSALRICLERAPNTPFIVVTGTLPDEAGVELIREGAADYILKDRLSRLADAVKRALEASHLKEAQREAEERFKLLFTEARDGIVLIDAKTGLTVECNAAFEHQTGQTLAALRAIPVWNLRPPPLRAAAQHDYEQVAKRGEDSNAELEFRRPDGTDLAVELRSKLVALRDKRYVLSISRDISERRVAESRLQEQLDELRRFQKVSVDREIRMQELEADIARLKGERNR